MIKLVDVKSEDEIEHIRKLFEEYADWLAFDLCFQDFETELGNLPGDYVPPYGRLILAYIGSKVAGCVALRRFDEHTCEMKRLYVRPRFRKKGLGRKLAIAVIEEAKKIGYKSMRLDTLSFMKEALMLYKSLGFKKIDRYRYNPIEGAMFLELNLTEE
ncbi:MAG: GNAT family N-acetyltransferase [candidate division Zixibacteria bacterium 4484_95]|nr:MAG: GNAT family N-acetyltransferase [candidate division Zixibacteria bacterium 4484_95]